MSNVERIQQAFNKTDYEGLYQLAIGMAMQLDNRTVRHDDDYDMECPHKGSYIRSGSRPVTGRDRQ